MTTTPAPDQRKHSHYHKDIRHLDTLDIYRVCDLFIHNDPSGAMAHAAKKILVAGGRGAKDTRKDIQEAIDTLQRKLEMLEEDAQLQQPLLVGVDPAHGPDAFAYCLAAMPPPDAKVLNDRVRSLLDHAVVCGAKTLADPLGQKPPSDPHAELRKTYAPGQRWQCSYTPGEWEDMFTEPLGWHEPSWMRNVSYRRHPDDVVVSESVDPSPDPHAQLKKAWAPGQRWQFRCYESEDWRDVAGNPAWNPHVAYRRHPDDIAGAKPWYPDESADWVEVHARHCDMPDGLSPGDIIEFIVNRERKGKCFNSITRRAGDLTWTNHHDSAERIVAYRIIKKAEKND